jgi:hypothetical protein
MKYQHNKGGLIMEFNCLSDMAEWIDRLANDDREGSIGKARARTIKGREFHRGRVLAFEHVVDILKHTTSIDDVPQPTSSRMQTWHMIREALQSIDDAVDLLAGGIELTEDDQQEYCQQIRRGISMVRSAAHDYLQPHKGD